MLDPIIEPCPSIFRPAFPNGAPTVHPMLGEPSMYHVYTDEGGTPLVIVYRYDNSDNSDNSDKKPLKEFRPYDLVRQKWKAPEVRPLYRLDALKEISGPVVIVEGEKCADALNDLGILATTVFGGCNGVKKTDFNPLKGRGVIIWPDFDEPGMGYRDKVALSLKEIGAAMVKFIDPEPLSLSFKGDMPKGWDVADAITDGWDRERLLDLFKDLEPYVFKESISIEEIPYKENAFKGNLFKEKTSIEKLGNGAANGCLKLKEPCAATVDLPLKLKEDVAFNNGNVLKLKEWGEPDMSVLNPRRTPPEFPYQLFGNFWGKWILAKAEGCSAPVDYVGMSLLSLLSALVGCSRFVSPWDGWKEPPMLWVALVGDPSSGKSPALESVLGIAREIEQDSAETNQDIIRQYEGDLLAAKCIRDDWEKQIKEVTKTGAPIPPMPKEAQEPNRPERPRIFVSDTTPEALARLLVHQSKGLLVMRDELSGWLGSFNRYSGGQGGDRAFWLEATGGRPYTIDRARNGGEAVTIKHLAASILGGIQPDKLHTLLLKGDDDGLPARFLFCWPDRVPQVRPKRAVESNEAETALRWLNGLIMIPDGQGGVSHGTVMLNDDAADFFQDWRKQHSENQPDGSMASWWGKMPGVCLRLALNFEYLWLSTTTRRETFEIKIPAVEAATVMIEQYLKPMAARAYGDASLPQAERNAATLAKWIIKNKPTRINVRETQRKVRLPGMRTAAEIKDAIEVLVEADWLRHDPKREGESNGKKSGDYVVNLEELDLSGKSG